MSHVSVFIICVIMYSNIGTHTVVEVVHNMNCDIYRFFCMSAIITIGLAATDAEGMTGRLI